MGMCMARAGIIIEGGEKERLNMSSGKEQKGSLWLFRCGQ